MQRKKERKRPTKKELSDCNDILYAKAFASNMQSIKI